MRFFRLIFLWFLFAWPCFASAQTITPHYYVVIGAFAKLENAERLTDKANKMNFEAQYTINAAKQLYYVFILKTSNKQEAFALDIKVKAETEFKDVWVFMGTLGDALVHAEVKPEEEPKVEKQIEELPLVIKEPEEEPVFIDSAATKKPEEKIIPAGKPFFFKMVNSETGDPVSGEIHIVQTTNDKQYQAVVSNETVYLPPPKNKNGTFQFVTLTLGYKEVKGTISYNNPIVSTDEMGSELGAVINMPLVRVKLGDYIEFSNVRFFQNTAILQPESQNELDGLVDLLKQNPKYKIRIRSHCNTYSTREITTMGSNTDFFAMGNGNEKKKLDAKGFTQLRADVVMGYLVQQGVEAPRIKTKGEGDVVMYYPKGSAFAYRNDRIEVEILKGK